MSRRVVITGMGVVSPVGNDIDTFFENLKNGVCGIDHIKKFDTTDLPVVIAAEVKDLDFSKDDVDRTFIRRNDQFSVFAMAAAIRRCVAMRVASTLTVSAFM